MKYRVLVLIGFVLCATIHVAMNQNFLEKKEAKIGKPAPNFELQDTTGKTHQLSDYQGQAVMIHFWSATCPFVVRYEDRLQTLTRDFKERDVVVLGINSNVNETPDQTREVADKRSVNYPILIDPDSQIADRYGAITTPHVFIVDQQGNLVYEGSVDDQGWSEKNPVTKNYARDVLGALAAGQAAPYDQTNSFGCTIKRAI